MIYNKEMECMPRKQMESLQLQRLKYIVGKAYDKVPFYRKRFDEIGLKPSHINTLKDIKLIPYTQKDDLRTNYPYSLFAAPLKDIVRIHASSGTTGKPIVAGYTKNDLDMWSESMARTIVAAGGSGDDIVQISFGYGLFTGALGLHQGFERLGATVVPVSSGNTLRQVMFLKDLKVTALVATPSYAMHIAEIMQQQGISKDDISLRLGLFGSEASTAEMHRALSEQLGIFTTDNYGLTEIIGPGVSGECRQKNGMHINEDNFYPEIMDIENNKETDEGKYGELVLTTLTKEGMPILRYRTKDITSIDYSPCKCGRTNARMSKIKGRTDDMLKIRGVNVFPSQIESVLVGLEEIGNHYEIHVKREGYLDSLEIYVEVVSGALLSDFKQLEALKSKVAFAIKTVLGIDVKVRLVEAGSLKRFEGKAKRVVDERNI
ncbi:MAG: phenylacetate--CoA ligase [Clostridia bacterium]|nr:phenylacetate--CoA ligase [Clostridia bacterium]